MRIGVDGGSSTSCLLFHGSAHIAASHFPGLSGSRSSHGPAATGTARSHAGLSPTHVAASLRSSWTFGRPRGFFHHGGRPGLGQGLDGSVHPDFFSFLALFRFRLVEDNAQRGLRLLFARRLHLRHMANQLGATWNHKVAVGVAQICQRFGDHFLAYFGLLGINAFAQFRSYHGSRGQRRRRGRGLSGRWSRLRRRSCPTQQHRRQRIRQASLHKHPP